MSDPFQGGSSVEALKWLKQYKQLDQKRIRSGLNETEQNQYITLSKKLAMMMNPKSSESIEQKRRNLRVNLRHEIRLQRERDFEKVYLDNISGGGVYVKTPHSAPIGSRVKIDLDIQSSGVHLNLTGEVAWVNSTGSGGLPPGLGIKFVDLDSDTQQKLLELIHSSLRENLNKRKSSRESSENE